MLVLLLLLWQYSQCLGLILAQLEEKRGKKAYFLKKWDFSYNSLSCKKFFFWSQQEVISPGNGDFSQQCLKHKSRTWLAFRSNP